MRDRVVGEVRAVVAMTLNGDGLLSAIVDDGKEEVFCGRAIGGCRQSKEENDDPLDRSGAARLMMVDKMEDESKQKKLHKCRKGRKRCVAGH
jgi:hypothetical protein